MCSVAIATVATCCTRPSRNLHPQSCVESLKGPVMKYLPLLALVCLIGCGSKGSPTAPLTPAPNSPPTPAPAPPPANRSPIIANATISPTFGIDALTLFSFSAVASDPDNDPLTYDWRFPSGTQFDTRATLITQLRGRTLDGYLNLTVADGRGGSATAASTHFVLASMTNTWALTMPAYPGEVLAYLQLEQDDLGAVTGSVTNGGRPIGPPSRIESNGRVEVRFKLSNDADVTFGGQMQQSGREIVGTFTAANATYRGSSVRGRAAVLSF
jgi:hypothetical protein